MQLNIDLGLKTYDILDPDGNITGTIRFNPSDPGFAGRWQQAEKRILEYHKKISENLSTGAPDIDQWETLMEASDAIKNAFDYAFAAPVSQVFFGGNSVFALTTSGHLVLENVLEGVYPVIEDALKEAADKARHRMETHTAPYQGTPRGLAPGQTLPD